MDYVFGAIASFVVFVGIPAGWTVTWAFAEWVKYRVRR